ncbi:MAG TPA: GntR family transcriptional regulator [Usitatibacteraceae bacterium]|jgi:DNA-binding GntR family transcriptional regulator|nr:GntR family transcriptional regulator [Usitatibacteraceae bacterium]
MEHHATIPADARSWLARYSRPGVPKYVMLRDAMVAEITGGAWPAGTRLPTEAEWAARVPLSLGTIQRALRMLADEGLVHRRTGQGTFVATRDTDEMRAPLHCRFLDDSGRGYLPVYSQVTAREEVAAEGPWSEHLGTAFPLLRIDRVLDINKEFAVFSEFYVDPQRMPAFARLPVRRLCGENFKEIIWRESHQPVARITQYLSSVRFSPSVAKATNMDRDTAGLLLEARAYLNGGSPIYYQRLYIPPNNRRLHLAGD